MTAAPPPEPGGLLPIEDYVASLARKRMGAGALAGRVAAALDAVRDGTTALCETGMRVG